MPKKRTYREFRQGVYRPENKEKCLNTSPVIFRSNLELKLMKILDFNANVIKWSSEQIIIPYEKPGPVKKMARYFTDAYVEIKIGEIIKKLIIEIKPERQTIRPVPSKRKKQSTILYESLAYAINDAKWKAAKEYAKKKDMEFIIITEKNIDFLEGKHK